MTPYEEKLLEDLSHDGRYLTIAHGFGGAVYLCNRQDERMYRVPIRIVRDLKKARLVEFFGKTANRKATMWKLHRATWQRIKDGKARVIAEAKERIHQWSFLHQSDDEEPCYKFNAQMTTLPDWFEDE